ncbi:MAG TPA: hypothetical protein ENI74_09240 [Gammaproteobacteria bacterium]|nr:hypothetical protein [Gammaproteobacteria bacterium]
MRRFVYLLAVLPLIAEAYDTRLAGFVGAELRGFVDDAQFDSQFNGFQPSLIVQPEITLFPENSDDQFNFIPFLRLDSRDSRRTHFDVREAYWLHVSDEWELLAGVNRVFWGVAESNHLVDIINQTDLVEDIDVEDKLGQPMINLSTQRDWGALSLFVMPWFRERTFPGRNGRLRFPLVTDGDPQYQSSDKQRRVDVALRYSHYIGAWDFGVSYFNGTGREPRFLLNSNATRLVPYYDLIKQVGTDIQFTYEGWLWKFEGLWRAEHGDHFLATVGGFEYTLYQLVESTADLGLLLEYSWDGRSSNPAEAPPVIFDDDIFMGTRLTLNDVQDSELLVGIVVDRGTRASQLSVEAERRLDNNWKLELESRWFINSGNSGLVSTFRNDSYVTLRVSRYF